MGQAGQTARIEKSFYRKDGLSQLISKPIAKAQQAIATNKTLTKSLKKSFLIMPTLKKNADKQALKKEHQTVQAVYFIAEKALK